MAALDSIVRSLRRSSTPTSRVGASGTPVYGGFVFEREKNAALTGRQRYKTFSNHIVNCTIVGASVRVTLNTVEKAKWKCIPPETKLDGTELTEQEIEEAKTLAKQFENILHDMKTPLNNIVKRVATGKFYGFSVHEIVGKIREDGVFGIEDIEPRPQITIRQWDIEDDGTVFGVVQREPQRQRDIYIPRVKMLYFVDDALNDSPEGLGLLRHTAEAVRQLMRLEELEGYGYETDLRGIPVARAPLSDMQAKVDRGMMKQSTMDKLLAPLNDFLKKHINNPALGLFLDSRTYTTTNEAMTPSPVRQFDIQVLDGGQKAHEPVDKAIRRKEKEIARAYTTEFLILGDDSAGSLALSNNKLRVFMTMIDGLLQDVAENMERDVRDLVWMMNGWNPDLKCRLITEKLSMRQVTEVTQALGDLNRAGLMPGDPAINEVREMLGLSPVDPLEVAQEVGLNVDGTLPEDDPIDEEDNLQRGEN